MIIDVTKFNRCMVLVVGDLMIDEYLWGDVERISPEAPVQVVAVQNEEFTLGGAGNVVNNLAALGADVCTVGVIGAGRDGGRLLKLFNGLDLGTEGIFQEPGRLTTRKTRVIAGSQHVLRIDHESRREISPETLERLIQFLEKKMETVDVVLVSDYGKGLITRPFLVRLLAAAEKHGKMTIADPKGLDFSKYAGISLLTPNRKEAAQASGIKITDDATLLEAGEKIMASAGIGNLLITCGKDGVALFQSGEELNKVSSQARQVFDVSGAGDTVLAVLGLAVAVGAPLEQAAATANTAAGIVVGKVGTATVSKKELTAALRKYPTESSAKQKTIDELTTIAGDLRKKEKQIVLTNGCFDLLHAGHVDLLDASKQMGDVLIVAIDDDASVRQLKGSGRPVIAARERVRILNAMDVVDYIVVFSSNRLEVLIEAVKPDTLTKGSNYTTRSVKGRELVEKLGGKVALVPVSGDTSSAQIIEDIKNS